jgi:hypothetical protein
LRHSPLFARHVTAKARKGALLSLRDRGGDVH